MAELAKWILNADGASVDDLRSGLEAGAEAVMGVYRPELLVALAELRQEFDFEVYPVVPNAPAYVRDLADLGMMGAALKRLRRLPPAGWLRLAAYGLANVRGVLAQEFAAMLGVMVLMELPIFSRFRPGVVFLHAQITDLMLACGNAAGFRAFADLVHRYGAEPGLETRNFGVLVPRLEDWGIDVAVIDVKSNRLPGLIEDGQEGSLALEESSTAWRRGRGLFWLELQPMCERIAAKISGDAQVEWPEYVVQKYFAETKPVPRCLSLCCGEGELERELAALGLFLECDAYDIDDAALERARHSALEAGFLNINYEMVDVNHLSLSDETYDVVVAKSALHHVKNLERVYEQIRKGLRPGGFLICDEYVGPSQFQFSERQMEVMNAALRILPKKYRRSISQQMRLSGRGAELPQVDPGPLFGRVVEKIRSGRIFHAAARKAGLRLARYRRKEVYKISIQRPTIGEMKLFDPSEAIRSAEIIPLLKHYFEIVETKEWGGTVLHSLLGDIAGNFDPNNETDMKVLDLVCRIEDVLIECGDLSSDFALVVVRKQVR